MLTLPNNLFVIVVSIVVSIFNLFEIKLLISGCKLLIPVTKIFSNTYFLLFLEKLLINNFNSLIKTFKSKSDIGK